MTTRSITSAITPGQEKQYLRFVEDAAWRALKETTLDKDSIQRLIEKGNAFQTRIIAAINELSMSPQFAHQEVQSSYAYPASYRVKGITEQTNILRRLFPGIGFANEGIAEQPLPPNAEGWFAIPKWETMAPTYGEAIEKVFAMIRSTRKFINYRNGLLGAEHLRQHAKTTKMFQKLGDEQKDYDILVIPAQFGLRHRGRSVHRAREVFQANEFGLGVFAVGIMLLTHPERLVQWNQLQIDCAGDEICPNAKGNFVGTPVFGFCANNVQFGDGWSDLALDYCGSASAFVSE